VNLRSGISKIYRRPFVLDENTFRRIYALLEKAATDLASQPSIVFRIEREDDRYYESISIDEVLSDPNVPNRRINITSIGLRDINQPTQTSPYRERGWIVQVRFDLDDNEVRIQIDTEDKNWSLLLADQLEPQIQRTFNVKATPRWTLALFFIPFLVVIVKFFRSMPSDSVFTSLSLITATVPIAMVPLFVIGSGKVTSKWFVTLFGPESAFLWGEEARYYKDRERTRQNIFWAIIVAFIVSLGASFVFLLIFPSNS
jgi:hypothetical protein